jgi:hypothetical protein
MLEFGVPSGALRNAGRIIPEPEHEPKKGERRRVNDRSQARFKRFWE